MKEMPELEFNSTLELNSYLFYYVNLKQTYYDGGCTEHKVIQFKWNF